MTRTRSGLIEHLTIGEIPEGAILEPIAVTLVMVRISDQLAQAYRIGGHQGWPGPGGWPVLDLADNYVARTLLGEILRVAQELDKATVPAVIMGEAAGLALDLLERHAYIKVLETLGSWEE
jgi:hypothetical protein